MEDKTEQLVESPPANEAGIGSGRDPATAAQDSPAGAPAAADGPIVPPDAPITPKRRRKSAKLTVRRGKPGGAPGVLRIDKKAPKPAITLVAYTGDACELVEHASIDDVRSALAQQSGVGRLLGKRATLWVRVVGLGDERVLVALRDLFKLHPLAMEDVVTVVQRPKAEQFGEHWFFVMRQTSMEHTLDTQQVSIFWGPSFVVSFEERPSTMVEPVVRRVREGVGGVRNAGPDYLAYSIIDASVDYLFPVLESYGERLEHLEESILTAPTEDTLARIQEVKHDLLVLRRSIWPLRDAVSALTRDESSLIKPETRVYMRDCYDHAVQLIDIIESYREFASGLADLLLSTISHRMNEVMKVLTIISTIFIPLSFIASVYGMNFDTDKSVLNMPELEWAWGYPFALLLMGGTAGSLLYYFKRKGWIGGRPANGRPPESGAT